MLASLRRLALGIALIVAASSLLLFSDLGSRLKSTSASGSSGPARIVRVALLQHASQPILDQGASGMLAGLAERGWVEGRNFYLKRYNAEGDMSVAQTIAREMVNGGNDLLLTVSTPSLQAVANANKGGAAKHVFALVTDPAAAGVGISRENPLAHPPWLAGYGTMQPVAQAFQIAREINHELRSVGVVYNASEANAEAQLRVARPVCADMGITLLETTVENSAGVGEAAAAAVARGAEAIWVCGDVTVITAIDSLIAAARKGGIPVFTVIPPNVRKGALFDIGANYHEVGRLAGVLAGDILNGRSPASVPIENAMPEMLAVNIQAAKGLKANWTIPAAVRDRASLEIDADGREIARATPTPAGLPKPSPGRSYRIGLASYAPDPSRDSCEKGLFDGLRELGFIEGKNLSVTRTHAQGETVNIPAMIQNLDTSNNDAIVTFTTPVLQGALEKARNTPVVFTYVTDPLAAGAGKTFAEHAPNVTGIGSLPPVADAIKTLRRILPKTRTLGVLSNSGEANSVKTVELIREACKREGLSLVELTVANTSEVMQAAQGLVSRGVDAIYLPSDNTVSQALDAVVQVATKAGVPLVNDDPSYLERGILLSVGPGFYHSGKAAAPLLARVLAGERPADIPLANVSVNMTKFNPAAAARLGLQIPPDVLAAIQPPQEARELANPSGKKWKISIVLYNETPPAEETLAGMNDAWQRSALVKGRDYEVTIRSAQADIAALNGILDAVATSNADLVVPLSTPSLQAAIHKIRRIPIVFSLVANPIAAGAGKSFTDHLANVTGIAVLGPVSETLDLLARYFPQYKRLGTLFCPSETNSVDLKEHFERLCRARGYTLDAIAANSPGELPDAALSLMARPIDAVVQISDNLSSAGFTAIAKAARQAQKPLLSLNSTTVPLGAAVGIGRDYHTCGEFTVGLIERVIRGENPSGIPFVLPPQVVRKASVPNARALGMTLPAGLLKECDTVIEN